MMINHFPELNGAKMLSSEETKTPEGAVIIAFNIVLGDGQATQLIYGCMEGEPRPTFEQLITEMQSEAIPESADGYA